VLTLKRAGWRAFQMPANAASTPVQLKFSFAAQPDDSFNYNWNERDACY
jgi:hypothetical protein